MPRYILHPGHVRSAFNGRWQFISAPMLRKLYLVPPGANCIDAAEPPRITPQTGDVHLWVSVTGDYPATTQRCASVPMAQRGEVGPVRSGR